jgi:hypothetical protein
MTVQHTQRTSRSSSVHVRCMTRDRFPPVDRGSDPPPPPSRLFNVHRAVSLGPDTEVHKSYHQQISRSRMFVVLPPCLNTLSQCAIRGKVTFIITNVINFDMLWRRSPNHTETAIRFLNSYLNLLLNCNCLGIKRPYFSSQMRSFLPLPQGGLLV